MKKAPILSIIILIICTTYLSAQKMTMGFIYPAGGEKGTTVNIEIGGLNIKNATEVLISGDGIISASLYTPDESADKRKRAMRRKLNDQSSPQLEERIFVKVTIDKKASPGLRDLRLKSAGGISNKLPFEIGQYPNQLEEKECTATNPNQVRKLPVTLCGQIMPGEIDYYSFQATKGIQLVAAAKGRALVPYIADAVPGWFQSVMRITNSKGKEIAFCDDYRNSVDPVIITTIPETDTYTLSIHDAIFRGREDFNYRIELGEIPYLIYASPVAGKVGKKTKVDLFGVNLKQNNLTYIPLREEKNMLSAPRNNNYLSNPIIFWGVSKTDNFQITPKMHPVLKVGDVIFDALDGPNQVKSYELYARKNDNIAIDVLARRIGSMMDPIIIVKDASGKTIQITDDTEDAKQGLMTHHADAQLQFRAKNEGTYTLEIQDLIGNYGQDHFYLLKRKENIPAFEVFVSPANLSIPKGGTGIFRIDILGKEKSVPALEFSVKGLPKGFKLSNLNTRPGTKTWEISITAPDDAEEKQLHLEVSATATIKGKEGKTATQKAIAADNMMQAFYYTHHIPAAGFVADITETAPFSLQLGTSSNRSSQHVFMINPGDSVISIPIRINRKAGFTEPVELALHKKSKQLLLDPVSFAPGETEQTIFLRINPDFKKSTRRYRGTFSIVGTVNSEIDKKGKRSFQNALFREYSEIFVLELTQE